MEDQYSEDLTASFRRTNIADHSNDELILRGSAAKKGKGGSIAMAIDGIAHTLSRRSLECKLAVLGLEHPGMIEYMVDITNQWGLQGYYKEVEALEITILDYKWERFGDEPRYNTGDDDARRYTNGIRFLRRRRLNRQPRI